MKKAANQFVILILLVTISNSMLGQAKYCPGLNVLGHGYDVFGEYASDRSVLDYRIFKFKNYEDEPMGSGFYKVPQFVSLKNISDHRIKSIEGSSVSEYSKSLSASVNLNVDAMFFSASINAYYGSSTEGSQNNFYFTYMDANTKWRVSINLLSRDIQTSLNPEFVEDLENLSPPEMFKIAG